MCGNKEISVLRLNGWAIAFEERNLSCHIAVASLSCQVPPNGGFTWKKGGQLSKRQQDSKHL